MSDWTNLGCIWPFGGLRDKEIPLIPKVGLRWESESKRLREVFLYSGPVFSVIARQELFYVDRDVCEDVSVWTVGKVGITIPGRVPITDNYFRPVVDINLRIGSDWNEQKAEEAMGIKHH